MTEKEIEDKIVQYVEELGGKALKLRIDGQNGFPDRSIFLDGCPVFFIEVKKPGGKLSDKQKEWIRWLEENYHFGYVVDNFEDAVAIIDELNMYAHDQNLDDEIWERCVLEHVVR